jgi:hypothetical protein
VCIPENDWLREEAEEVETREDNEADAVMVPAENEPISGDNDAGDDDAETTIGVLMSIMLPPAPAEGVNSW